MCFTYQDVEEYYKKLNEWTHLAELNSNQFWTNIVNHYLSKVDNMQMKNDNCIVDYTPDMLEKRALSISLFLMSWVLENFRKKTEDGHCQNVNHSHGDRHPRMCMEGSVFHMEMYNECLSSFEEVIEAVKKIP